MRFKDKYEWHIFLAFMAIILVGFGSGFVQFLTGNTGAKMTRGFVMLACCVVITGVFMQWMNTVSPEVEE